MRVQRLNFPERVVIIALAILFVSGLVAHLYATRWGIGLSPDSATYISGAIGIASGKGYSFPLGDRTWQPISLWPPMYSIVLALPIALGADPLSTARLLNGALLGANAALIAVLLRRLPRTPLLVPVLGAAFFLLDPDVVYAHGWAWSEGLFLFLGFLGLLYADRYVASQKRRDLVLSAAMTGLALMTRYSGIAFVATGALAVTVLPVRRAFKSPRLLDAILFAAVSSALFAAWSLRNALVAGTTTGAEFTSLEVRPDEWSGAYRVLSLWFMPGRIAEPTRTYIMFLVGLLFVGAAIVFFREAYHSSGKPEGDAAHLGLIALSFSVNFALVLVFSRLFVRKFPLDDPRQLLPLYPALIVAFCALGWMLRRKARLALEASTRVGAIRWLVGSAEVAIAGYLLLLLASHSLHAAQWILDSHSRGMGYSNDSWRSNALVEMVRSLPGDIPVYSNGYDALFLLTRREVHPLPEESPATPPPRMEALPAAWEEMVEALRSQRGLIVFFNRPTRRGMVTEETVTETLTLCASLAVREGRVFRWCD